MIRYQLTCPKSHAFEGWFASSAAFDVQVKKKLVECPSCGSAKVTKALMAPNVVTSERKSASRTKRRTEHQGQTQDGAALQVADAGQGSDPNLSSGRTTQIAPSPEQREAMRQLRKLRDAVLAKSDYVGPRLADEARRMHTGETPNRGIHGEASLDDVKSLAEDGIEVYPLPILPDDQN